MNQTILLIEDNEEMRENIAAILELAHYHVLTAGNGKVGVALAQQHKPNLVLCDVMMPELDGYGVLHILSKDITTVGIPFIFLTSKTEKTDIRTGMMLGADDYLTKPFDGSELLSVIEVRLRKQKLINEVFQHDGKDIDFFFERTKHITELQQLSENRPIRKVRKKEFIFMEGQNPIDLFYIRKGLVRTFKTSADGKELVTGIHHEGTFIGFVALLENSSYAESAVAMVDTELQLILKNDFGTLLYANREVSAKFIKLLANNLVETEQRLMEMAYQSVRQRVAGSLLKILETEQHDKTEQAVSLSRKDLAGIVGTATESINRTLGDFRDEGIVELNDHEIRILNVQKLQRAAR